VINFRVAARGNYSDKKIANQAAEALSIFIEFFEKTM
jgi:hypothetical protein